SIYGGRIRGAVLWWQTGGCELTTTGLRDLPQSRRRSQQMRQARVAVEFEHEASVRSQPQAHVECQSTADPTPIHRVRPRIRGGAVHRAPTGSAVHLRCHRVSGRCSAMSCLHRGLLQKHSRSSHSRLHEGTSGCTLSQEDYEARAQGTSISSIAYHCHGLRCGSRTDLPKKVSEAKGRPLVDGIFDRALLVLHKSDTLFAVQRVYCALDTSFCSARCSSFQRAFD